MENRSTMFSSSECITWFALFLTESVAIVTVNLLSIIIFIKNSNLRTRAMYLVINLTVADNFVGGISSIFLFEILGYDCQIVTVGSNTAPEGNITLFVFRWFPLTSLTSISTMKLKKNRSFTQQRMTVIAKTKHASWGEISTFFPLEKTDFLWVSVVDYYRDACG